MATTLKPGQKITISYTAKGYAITIANEKKSEANSKEKYYSNLEALLTDPLFSQVTLSSSSKINDSHGSLTITKASKSTPLNTFGFNDSVRPYTENVLYDIQLPGYKNAYFEFVNVKTGEVRVVGFMVSPSSVNHSYSNTQQVSKTMAGWYIMRTGKNLQEITLAGYMMDTRYCQERHDFIEQYKQYIEDKKNANNEYVNEWSANLIIEGRKYVGFVQGLGIQKSSIQPFLYQYNISYISVNDFLIYRTTDALNNRRTVVPPKYSIADATSDSVTMLGDTVGGLLGV